jgi:hypothetical protein
MRALAESFSFFDRISTREELEEVLALLFDPSSPEGGEIEIVSPLRPAGMVDDSLREIIDSEGSQARDIGALTALVFTKPERTN